MSKFFRLLLLLAVLAGAYYAYTQMADSEENPAGIQWSDWLLGCPSFLLFTEHIPETLTARQRVF